MLLFASTADREWNDIVASPVNAILMSQIVMRLTEVPQEKALSVGQPMVVPIPAEQARDTALVRDPLGNDTKVDVEKQATSAAVRFAATESPGFYEIRLTKDAKPTFVAVNVRVGEESDVTCMDEAKIKSALAGLPVRVISQATDLGDSIRTTRQGREMWRVLLVIGLLMLLAESFLAHWFSKRMAVATVTAANSAQELLGARARREDEL